MFIVILTQIKIAVNVKYERISKNISKIVQKSEKICANPPFSALFGRLQSSKELYTQEAADSSHTMSIRIFSEEKAVGRPSFPIFRLAPFAKDNT